MAKDKIGNELAIGDLVEIELPSPRCIGRITGHRQGGRIAIGGQKGPGDKALFQPEVVTVSLSDVNMLQPSGHEGQPFERVVKIYDPSPDDGDDKNKKKKLQ